MNNCNEHSPPSNPSAGTKRRLAQ